MQSHVTSMHLYCSDGKGVESHLNRVKNILQNLTSLVTKLFYTPGQYTTTKNQLSQSQSHIATDGQSAWSILVSSPVWGSWPDISYSLTATVLSLWGAPSDKGTGMSFVRVIVGNNVSCQYVQYIQFKCSYIMEGYIYIYIYTHTHNMYKASVSPGSVQQIMLYFQ
jgi:hypothetical protein